MVYARINDPETVSWEDYEIEEQFIIDGGRDLASINDDYLKDIEKLMDDYLSYNYEFYYHNSIKAYLEDMLPKKTNGKKLSPIEIKRIKNALDMIKDHYYSEYKPIITTTVLSIILGEKYVKKAIRGCCQGDYATLYCLESTTQDEIDYIEGIYFGTATEIEIHDDDYEPETANDICGYNIITTKWNDKDIKQEIANYTGINANDVVLFKFSHYQRIPVYEKC